MDEVIIQLMAIAGFIFFCWWLLFNKNKNGKYYFRLKNLNQNLFLVKFIKFYAQLIIFAFILVILIFVITGIF